MSANFVAFFIDVLRMNSLPDSQPLCPTQDLVPDLNNTFTIYAAGLNTSKYFLNSNGTILLSSDCLYDGYPEPPSVVRAGHF